MDSAEHIQDHPCRAVLPPSADPCAPEAAPMGTLAATAAAASTLTAVVEQPAAVEQCHDPSTPLAPADLSYRPKGAAALVKVASATAGTSMLPAATADTQQAPVAAAEQVSVPAPSSSLIPQQLQQQQVEVNASLDLFEIQGLISSDHSVGDIDQELVEDQDDPQQDVDMMDRDQDAGAMICSHICMVGLLLSYHCCFLYLFAACPHLHNSVILSVSHHTVHSTLTCIEPHLLCSLGLSKQHQ